MDKFVVANGKYVVYANTVEDAREVLIQELGRVDDIKAKMLNLLTVSGQAYDKFNENTSENRLNINFNDEASGIYDKDTSAKGSVRQRATDDGEIMYDLAYRYPEIDGHNADFRLAHEMGHLMLNPSRVSQQRHDEKSNSRQVTGLIRKDEESGNFYGGQIQENAINLLAQLGIREDISADDIISGKADLSEFNSYRRCDDLVKLLAVSMRNDFDQEMSFEQLAEQKIDSMIEHSDGTSEPANTFFYGIVNDSNIIENEFDQYLGKGAWRELNDAFTQLYDKNLSQEKFDLIFESAQGLIREFANIRYQDKYKQAAERNEGKDIPGLEDKIKLLDEMTGADRIEENSVSEHDETVKTYEEKVEENVRTENEDSLSFRQKIAQFFQKNKLLMNLPFVQSFIHKQLDVLPPPQQSMPKRDIRAQEFENWITRNGTLRNLPPIQRMSDPVKMEHMRRTMQESKKSDGMEK